jgi:hypothetical protein
MERYDRLKANCDALSLYLNKHPQSDPYLNTLLRGLINALLDYAYVPKQEDYYHVASPAD